MTEIPLPGVRKVACHFLFWFRLFKAGDMDLDQIKKEARVAATAARLVAHEQWQDRATLALASMPFPLKAQPNANVVSAFHPYQSEIDTRMLLGKLAGEGWTTCLPIVLGKGLPLEFRRWLPGEPLVKGVWGIERPPDTSQVVEPDVLIIPLLAFDRQGYRLGYGGGFYDRTLEKLRVLKNIVAIGVGYSGQEVDAVPHGAHDQPLDYMMTEKEIFKCG
jgi:5-formyltetrahydrofolate cyclo-ligase